MIQVRLCQANQIDMDIQHLISGIFVFGHVFLCLLHLEPLACDLCCVVCM